MLQRLRYKQIILLLFGLYFEINGIAQITEIKGNVNDYSNKPIEYFHSVLLSPEDSMIITGGAFIDGWFELSYPIKSKCLLLISSIGYQKIYIPIIPVDNTVLILDTIKLKSLELDMVNVFAKRPVYSQKHGKLIVNVQSTSLSNAGNSIDVLKQAPGVQIDADNNINIFGKGEPLVFINDKEIVSKQELEILQSNDIVDIRIDRNPSAKYSASAQAVIHIKTRKTSNEHFNMEIYNRSYFARKTSNITGIKVNNKVNKFTNYFNYFYLNNNRINYSDDYENNYLSGYTVRNRSSLINTNQTLRHNLLMASNYSISSKSEIGIQYVLSNKNYNSNSSITQKIIKTNEPESEIERLIKQYGNAFNNQQVLSTIYKSDFDSTSTLLIVFDYAKLNDDETTDISENNKTKLSFLNSTLDNNNRYNVLTLKSEYSFTFLKEISTLFGIKLAQIDNNGNVELTSTTGITNYNITNYTNDRISAAYFTSDKQFNKFLLSLGLRGEITDSYVSENNELIQDSVYFNLFPSLSISFQPAEKIDVSLNYSRKIDRPSFSEINP